MRIPTSTESTTPGKVDGITEVSLAGVPRHHEAMAAAEDGSTYLLARSQEGSSPGPFTLWRLTALSPEAERLEPPPASVEWSHLATAPDDGSLWALGKGALAHREADGRWTMHTLPDPKALLLDFLALPGGRAVVLRSVPDGLQFLLADPGSALDVSHASHG